MYKATGEDSYLQKAESFYDQFNLGETPSEFSWDNKVAGVQVGNLRIMSAVLFLHCLHLERSCCGKPLRTASTRAPWRA